MTGEVVDAAYQVHTRLGPGLLENVYEAVLARALERRGLAVEQQKLVPFEFDGMHFDAAFRVDLLVEGRVVVELKALEKLAPIHTRQVLTYLRLLDAPIGLLINFGALRLNDGLQRIANGRATSARSLLGRTPQDASATSAPLIPLRDRRSGSGNDSTA